MQNKESAGILLTGALWFSVVTVHRKLLFKPRPAKETMRRRGCVLKTADHHPTSQARCDATSIQDILKQCACANAHDPTPSCCRQNWRAIGPLPAEIEFTRCHG